MRRILDGGHGAETKLSQEPLGQSEIDQLKKEIEEKMQDANDYALATGKINYFLVQKIAALKTRLGRLLNSSAKSQTV
jgi:hypothetical protein